MGTGRNIKGTKPLYISAFLPKALNKINKWQVFWLNVYFDLPIRIFANSGVREVTLLLKKIKGPFYSYGDSSGF